MPEEAERVISTRESTCHPIRHIQACSPEATEGHANALVEGGKIYTLADKKVFRVKKKADDKVDRKFSFNHVPFAAAWKKCIDFIAS